MKVEYIFAVFAVIAVIDKVTGNRFKLGDEFEKGFSMAAPLILSMAGMVVLTPIISKGLTLALGGILNLLGMDLSVVASFFPVDSGGAMIAYELSSNRQISAYNGIIIASMFGATICPVVPLALNTIDKKYHNEVLLGFLCGFATIPLGCIVSGIIMKLSIGTVIVNALPAIIVSVIICIGLVKKPNLVQKIISFIGDLLFKIMLVGLGIGIVDKLTGVKIIPQIASVDEAFLIIGYIVIILSGIFPLLAIVTKLCGGLFSKVGNVMGINTHSVMGLITSLANCIPTFGIIENMDRKGRCLNMAFAVSAAFVFGDHLAFTLSFDNEFALPLIAGKLVGGITAVILANFVFKAQEQKMNKI